MRAGPGRWWDGEGGARAARVALSPESRAPRNACIIIMTDADRAAAPLICGTFDLAARSRSRCPCAQTSRLTFIRFDAARRVVRPFALALNRGFICKQRERYRARFRGGCWQWCARAGQNGVCWLALGCARLPLSQRRLSAVMPRRRPRSAFLNLITWTLCVCLHSDTPTPTMRLNLCHDAGCSMFWYKLYKCCVLFSLISDTNPRKGFELCDTWRVDLTFTFAFDFLRLFTLKK